MSLRSNAALADRVIEMPEFHAEQGWWMGAYAKSLTRKMAINGAWIGPVTIGSSAGESRSLKGRAGLVRVMFTHPNTGSAPQIFARGLLAEHVIEFDDIRRALNWSVRKSLLNSVVLSLLGEHVSRVQAEVDAMLIDQANVEFANRRREASLARTLQQAREARLQLMPQLIWDLVEDGTISEEALVKWYRDAVVECVMNQ